MLGKVLDACHLYVCKQVMQAELPVFWCTPRENPLLVCWRVVPPRQVSEGLRLDELVVIRSLKAGVRRLFARQCWMENT